jgi:hypothetical protein
METRTRMEAGKMINREQVWRQIKDGGRNKYCGRDKEGRKKYGGRDKDGVENRYRGTGTSMETRTSMRDGSRKKDGGRNKDVGRKKDGRNKDED